MLEAGIWSTAENQIIRSKATVHRYALRDAGEKLVLLQLQEIEFVFLRVRREELIVTENYTQYTYRCTFCTNIMIQDMTSIVIRIIFSLFSIMKSSSLRSEICVVSAYVQLPFSVADSWTKRFLYMQEEL